MLRTSERVVSKVSSPVKVCKAEVYEDELMLGSNDTAHRMDSLSEQLLSAILLSAHIAPVVSCSLASFKACCVCRGISSLFQTDCFC